MITRRALFLGSAAIITTPGLLMPVRKLVVPSTTIELIDRFRRAANLLAQENAYLAANPPLIVHAGWDLGKPGGDYTAIVKGELRKGFLHFIDGLVIHP